MHPIRSTSRRSPLFATRRSIRTISNRRSKSFRKPMTLPTGGRSRVDMSSGHTGMVSRASTSNDSDDLTVWNACIEIVDATRDSLERHIPHPDQFDDEMPCYCALATFGTFLSLLVSDETRFRPILDCIRRC